MIAIFRWSAWIAVVCLWVYTVLSVNNLPDTIPIHFDINNQPDNYGSRHTLWLLPVIATLIVGFLQLSQRAPDKINYPVKITEENKSRQQQLVLLLLGYVGLLIPTLFLFIVYSIVRTVHHGTFEFSILVLIGAVLLPIVVYFLAARKAR